MQRGIGGAGRGGTVLPLDSPLADGQLSRCAPILTSGWYLCYERRRLKCFRVSLKVMSLVNPIESYKLDINGTLYSREQTMDGRR